VDKRASRRSHCRLSSVRRQSPHFGFHRIENVFPGRLQMTASNCATPLQATRSVLAFTEFIVPGYKAGGPMKSMVHFLDHVAASTKLVIRRNVQKSGAALRGLLDALKTLPSEDTVPIGEPYPAGWGHWT
jgi:hypothetical protein